MTRLPRVPCPHTSAALPPLSDIPVAVGAHARHIFLDSFSLISGKKKSAHRETLVFPLSPLLCSFFELLDPKVVVIFFGTTNDDGGYVQPSSSSVCDASTGVCFVVFAPLALDSRSNTVKHPLARTAYSNQQALPHFLLTAVLCTAVVFLPTHSLAFNFQHAVCFSSRSQARAAKEVREEREERRRRQRRRRSRGPPRPACSSPSVVFIDSSSRGCTLTSAWVPHRRCTRPRSSST